MEAIAISGIDESICSQGWPKFANMVIMGTPDNGAAVARAPHPHGRAHPCVHTSCTTAVVLQNEETTARRDRTPRPKSTECDV